MEGKDSSPVVLRQTSTNVFEKLEHCFGRCFGRCFRRSMTAAVLSSAVLLSSVAVTGCGGSKTLLTPTFSTLSAGQPVVTKAVHRALLENGWTITADKPGRVEARLLDPDDYWVDIAVLIAGAKVTIQYVNSSNLGYGAGANGAPVIKSSYNKWVINLQEDISEEIADKL